MQHWTAAQPAVAGFIRALLRDAEAARDVLQETALVLFRRFREYDGERPFVAWALGVARWRVLGHHRDAARCLLTFDEELLERFTEQWAAAAPAADRRAWALQECVEGLPGRARELVRQRYYEERTAEEIAAQTGAQGASIRVALQRIREQLRECIERRMQAEGGAL